MSESEIEYSQELINMVMPGKKVEYFYGDNHASNKLCHILAIVDQDQVVYKYWKKSRWVYKVDWMYKFHLAFIDGYLLAKR